MYLSLNLNPFFAKNEPISKKSEPIFQNEPIRIFVSYSPITHRKRLRIGYNSESFSVKSACVGINPLKVDEIATR